MATVDQVTLKVNVDGATNLDQLNSRLDSLDANSRKATSALNQIQGGVRNTAYQVQDLAVQIAGGTNAFVALGQQLPQLLSGFGTMGIVVGAIAAIALPLLRIGLEAAGYDFRNLNERLSALTTSTQEFQAAQRANLPTMAGMSNSFGAMSESAKEFFAIQQQLKERKAYSDLAASLEELRDKYKRFTAESTAAAASMEKFTPGATGAKAIVDFIQQWRLGVTAEQARYLGESLKDIDKKKPEEAVRTLNDIAGWIEKTFPLNDKFRRQWEETIGPILKTNNEIIELNRNIRDSEQRATALNAAILEIQNRYQPNVNAFRRNFDQISAFRLEGEQKIAEFTRQINERSSQDGVDRSRELAAFRTRTQQEVLDRSRDFVKSQDEAYRASQLQFGIRRDQIGVEQDILRLSDQSKLSAFNLFQLNADLLKNAETYRETQTQIAEQRRRNVIDTTQAAALDRAAADVRARSDELARAAADRRLKDYIFLQSESVSQEARRLQLFTRTAALTDTQRRNAEEIFTIEEERRKQLQGIAEIKDTDQRAAREKQINDIFDQRVVSIRAQQTANRNLAEDFATGWQRALNTYVEQSRNSFDLAGQLFRDFTTGMEDAFVQFAETGKLSFNSLLKTIATDILRSNIRTLFSQLFSGGPVGGGGNLITSFFGGVKSLFGFAAGGSVGASTPILVGERGPEIFVPPSAGTIIPNSQLSAGAAMMGTQVTYHISAVDAPSFQRMLAANPQFLHAVAEQGRLSIPGQR